jgi:hypothetical protein
MKVESISLRKSLLATARFLLIAFVFAIAYTQKPLYYDNQTTKFLHGLAQAGYGFLENDWLANTLDPLPAFTFLVRMTHSYLNESAFYFYYIIICGIYIYSIAGIVSLIFPIDINSRINSNKLQYLTFLTIIILLHCINIEIKFLDLDTALSIHYGLAEQYVLGPYFQPSNFGVFIIFSIYRFLHRKYFLAVACLGLAATFHPTYLMGAAIISLTYLIIIYKNEGNFIKVLSVGSVAVVLLLPVFSYMYFQFRPTSAEIWTKSQYIIVQLRIPHHSIPQVFLSKPSAYLQIFLVVLALYLIRKTKVFAVIFIPFVITATLTSIQIFYPNNTIAFIAPWRISAVLVPIATSIIIGWLVSYLFARYSFQIAKHKKNVMAASLATISMIFAIGLYNQVQMFAEQDSSIPMLNFVKKTTQQGDLYLVPNKNKQLRKFRLYTGAPILVNFKSHPYKDIEVLEWYRRNLAAQEFYEASSDRRCDTLRQIAANYQINKVVTESRNFSGNCNFLAQLYRDDRYGVYQLLGSRE